VTAPSNRLRAPLWLAAAAAALCLVAAAGRDFWAPDEPDFAEHVREMLGRKSLLLPYENGKPYSEKPILFYWAVAATTPFSAVAVHASPRIEPVPEHLVIRRAHADFAGSRRSVAVQQNAAGPRSVLRQRRKRAQQDHPRKTHGPSTSNSR